MRGSERPRTRTLSKRAKLDRPIHPSIIAEVMAKQRLSTLMVITVFTGAMGCVGAKRDHYLSFHPIAVAEPSDDANAIWDAAQETLRRHRYRLDRVDRRAGVITTMPMISQHFFEFWRRDVATAEDLWEATLNPMRRWVTVSVEYNGDNAWTRIGVTVHKERLSSPGRSFNSTGAALQHFRDRHGSMTGRRKNKQEHTVWIDEGRDAALEEYLLQDMLSRAGLDSAINPHASAQAGARDLTTRTRPVGMEKSRVLIAHGY